MKCIFCKKDTSDSKSVEHIIPESLGNTEHVLPKGIVCDSCNNYFACKIERPLLEMPYFKNIRYRNSIKSKKGKLVPGVSAILSPKGRLIETCIFGRKIELDIEEKEFLSLTEDRETFGLIILAENDPKKNDRIISRFLAKVALETLAYKIIDEKEWIDEIVNKIELNPLRNYARYGGKEIWEYNQRRIYTEDTRFNDIIIHPEPYEILHEFGFVWIKEGVLCFVLVIMGIEYAINLGESETDLYNKWLEENNFNTPLRRPSESIVEALN